MIGWFDVLGYKSLIENNQIEDVIKIVQQMHNAVEEAQKRLRESESCAGQECCDCVVFSDTVLIYSPLSKGTEHLSTAFLAEFSADLLNNLFWAGLPIRGAWGFVKDFV